MNMEIVVPSDQFEDVMGCVNSRWGETQGIDPGHDTQTLRAYVPMADVLNYAATRHL